MEDKEYNLIEGIEYLIKKLLKESGYKNIRQVFLEQIDEDKDVLEYKGKLQIRASKK